MTLTGDGTGQLVLSGTSNYSGGTIVEAGTLIVAEPYSLADGSSLTVGADASSIFGTSGAASPGQTAGGGATFAGAAAPVPEPGTVALLLAGLAVGFGLWRRRSSVVQTSGVGTEYLVLRTDLVLSAWNPAVSAWRPVRTP